MNLGTRKVYILATDKVLLLAPVVGGKKAYSPSPRGGNFNLNLRGATGPNDDLFPRVQ